MIRQIRGNCSPPGMSRTRLAPIALLSVNLKRISHPAFPTGRRRTSPRPANSHRNLFFAGCASERLQKMRTYCQFP